VFDDSGGLSDELRGGTGSDQTRTWFEEQSTPACPMGQGNGPGTIRPFRPELREVRPRPPGVGPAHRGKGWVLAGIYAGGGALAESISIQHRPGQPVAVAGH